MKPTMLTEANAIPNATASLRSNFNLAQNNLRPLEIDLTITRMPSSMNKTARKGLTAYTIVQPTYRTMKANSKPTIESTSPNLGLLLSSDLVKPSSNVLPYPPHPPKVNRKITQTGSDGEVTEPGLGFCSTHGTFSLC
jgi:hypothetical protein